MNNNVLYIEPNSQKENYQSDNNNLNNIILNKPEDYCISIDLLVEVTKVASATADTNSQTFVYTWITHKGMKGGDSELSIINAKQSHLTSNPSLVGKYSINDENTSECFGINSINIDYNNYSMPQVSIEFTDIHGVSLFAPEENNFQTLSNDNNIYNDYDTSSSFFKCFFTFPYPKFKLRIKGFYGEPVLYELCCVDFRAKFNCKTGNFGATVNFVGYSFAFLNDISFNSLIVAPYDNYAGKHYWEQRHFQIDGCAIPTIHEILKRFWKIENNITNLEETSNSETNLQEKQELKENIDNAYLWLKEYVINIKSIFGNKEGFHIVEKSNFYFAIYSKYSSDSEAGMVNIPELKNKENILINALDTIEFDITELSIHKEEVLLSEVQNKSNVIEELKSAGLVDSESESYAFVTIYNAVEVSDILSNRSIVKNKEIQEATNGLNQQYSQYITEVLGFKPTVRNITFIILAHLETLVNAILTCTNNVNNSSRSFQNFSTRRPIVKSNSSVIIDSIPPFPQLATLNNNLTEEDWIGNYNAQAPETLLVENFCVAVKNMLQETEELYSFYNDIDNTEQEGDNSPFTPEIPNPVTVHDLMIENNPFKTTWLNYNDFIKKIGIRMASFGLNKCNLSSQNAVDAGQWFANNAGEMDAKNILASQTNNFSATFFKQLENEDIVNQVLKDLTDTENIKAWESVINQNNLYTLQGENYKYYSNDIQIDNFELETTEEEKLTLNNKGVQKNIDIKYINQIITNVAKYRNVVGKLNKSLIDNVTGWKSTSNSTDQSTVLYRADEYFNGLIRERFYNSQDGGQENDLAFDEKDPFGLNYIYNNDNLPNTSPYGQNFKSNLHTQYYDGFDDDYHTFSKMKNIYYGTHKLDGQSKKLGYNKDLLSIFKNDNSSNKHEYTITSIPGIWCNATDNRITLFGQVDYYYQTNNKIRALLFLHLFKVVNVKDEAYVYDIRYDEIVYKSNIVSETDNNHMKGFIRIDNVVDMLSTSNIKAVQELPYLAVLLIGGLIWYNTTKDKGLNDVVWTTKLKTATKAGWPFESRMFNLPKNYTLIDEHLRTVLENEFISWVTKKEGVGFAHIQDLFELDKLKGVSDYDKIKKEIEAASRTIMEKNDSTTYQNVVKKLFTKKDINTYMSVNAGIDNFNSTNSLLLLIRESCVGAKLMTELITKSCYIFSSVISPQDYLTPGFCTSYLWSLIEGIKGKNSNQTNTFAVINQNNIDVKLSLYKHFQLLWDKWINGANSELYKVENFMKKWFFIDSYYYNVENDLYLDISYFCNLVYESQLKNDFSLLSFLSKIYAKNSCDFHCTQNFLAANFTEENSSSDYDSSQQSIQRIFTPIPYNEELKDNTSLCFIVMYRYEPSSYLDMQGNKNDSFDLNSNDLPMAIVNKTSENGFKIPAFGVNYSQANQSYFTDINVSMDRPVVTDQSLVAQFNIIGATGQKEGEHKVSTIGQNIYSIYSNNSYTCQVKMMGCAWIQPLMYFQLLNIPMFHGAYLIYKVSHRIKPGNMETIFHGVRMAKIATRKVRNIFCSDENFVDSNPYNNDYANKNAKIFNNCQYKFYLPNSLSKTALSVLTSEDLSMTVADYETKYHDIYISSSHNKFSLGEENNKVYKSKTILELISSVVWSESNSEGEIGQRLVLATIYNRMVEYGNNLFQVLDIEGKQYALRPDAEPTEQQKEDVKNFMKNGPSLLLGVTTSANTKYLVHGKTPPNKTLEESDISRIDSFVTAASYKDDNWHGKNCYFICSHKAHLFFATKEENLYSFASSAQNENVSIDTIAQDIFTSAIKSLEYAEDSTKTKITKKSIDCFKDNSFIITIEPNELYINMFDVLFNTYDRYINSIKWGVKNDTSELPSGIMIEFSETEHNGVDAFFDIYNMNNITAIYNCGGKDIPKEMWAIIEKHFQKYSLHIWDKISILQTQMFNNDFDKDSMSESIQNAFNEKNIDIEDCMTKYLSEGEWKDKNGFLWEVGERKDYYKKKENYKKWQNIEYNVSNAIKKIKKDVNPSDKHTCAKHVREAISEGFTSIHGKDYAVQAGICPKSAAAYVNFLPLFGFQLIYKGNPIIPSSITLQKGDIEVLASNSSNIHGHIQMYIGNDAENKNTPWYSYYAGTINTYNRDDWPIAIFRHV